MFCPLPLVKPVRTRTGINNLIPCFRTRAPWRLRVAAPLPQSAIAFTSRKRDKTKLLHSLIKNGPRGYTTSESGVKWRDLKEFVAKHRQHFVHPIPSALHFECKQEIAARRRTKPVRTAFDFVFCIKKIWSCSCATCHTSVFGPWLAKLLL